MRLPRRFTAFLAVARTLPANRGTLVAFERLMRATYLKWLYLGVGVAWAGLAWVAYSYHSEPAAALLPTAPATEKHYVTPAQLADSGAHHGRPVKPFTAVTHDGRAFAWEEFAAGQLVVLVFIKKDCPCSAEFEPFFQRLAMAYRGRVRFLGVIDADRNAARRYAEANRVAYPVIADADCSVIRQFQAENGGYIALVRPGGTVEALWPGCSAEMMRDVNRRLAQLAGVDERPLDTAGLPAALTTGCPYAVER